MKTLSLLNKAMNMLRICCSNIKELILKNPKKELINMVARRNSTVARDTSRMYNIGMNLLGSLLKDLVRMIQPG